MTVKLVLLKSGEHLVSEIKEGYFENKLICFILDRPCKVLINGSYRIGDEEKVSISLNSWPALSEDTTVELSPDWVVTVVEPNDQLKKMYETQVLGIKQYENNQSDLPDEQSDSYQSD
jgi:Uma2 family endonuclease